MRCVTFMNILIAESFLSQLAYCRLIHSCIHHVLEVGIIEVGLHKLRLLFQHSSYNRHHVIIEGNLGHLSIAILHGIHKI